MVARLERNSKRAGLAGFGMLLLALLVRPAKVGNAGSPVAAPRDTVPPAAAEGAAIFKSNCVACHGAGGKGDGPAAVAFHPPPANLTDTARLSQVSDDSLIQVITHGRRAMPPFKDELSSEQVRQVVAYIRTLKP